MPVADSVFNSEFELKVFSHKVCSEMQNII